MIWLDGVQIADPTKLDIGIQRISRAERTASGRMVIDVIAIKRTVNLEYNVIDGSSLATILNALESRAFHVLRYPDSQGGERTITVHAGEISKTRWRTIAGVQFWQGVTIGLTEQ